MHAHFAYFHTSYLLHVLIVARRQEINSMLVTVAENLSEMAELGWVVAMYEDDVQGLSVVFI